MEPTEERSSETQAKPVKPPKPAKPTDLKQHKSENNIKIPTITLESEDEGLKQDTSAEINPNEVESTDKQCSRQPPTKPPRPASPHQSNEELESNHTAVSKVTPVPQEIPAVQDPVDDLAKLLATPGNPGLLAHFNNQSQTNSDSNAPITKRLSGEVQNERPASKKEDSPARVLPKKPNTLRRKDRAATVSGASPLASMFDNVRPKAEASMPSKPAEASVSSTLVEEAPVSSAPAQEAPVSSTPTEAAPVSSASEALEQNESASSNSSSNTAEASNFDQSAPSLEPTQDAQNEQTAPETSENVVTDRTSLSLESNPSEIPEHQTANDENLGQRMSASPSESRPSPRVVPLPPTQKSALSANSPQTNRSARSNTIAVDGSKRSIPVPPRPLIYKESQPPSLAGLEKVQEAPVTKEPIETLDEKKEAEKKDKKEKEKKEKKNKEASEDKSNKGAKGSIISKLTDKLKGKKSSGQEEDSLTGEDQIGEDHYYERSPQVTPREGVMILGIERSDHILDSSSAIESPRANSTESSSIVVQEESNTSVPTPITQADLNNDIAILKREKEQLYAELRELQAQHKDLLKTVELDQRKTAATERHKVKQRQSSKSDERSSDNEKVGEPIFQASGGFTWSGGSNPEDSFAFLKKLGEGPLGSIYLCRHNDTGFEIAIKVIPSKGAQPAAQIQRQIEALKSLESNSLLTYYGTCISENEIWIMMEHCCNKSVSNLMETYLKTLNEQQIAPLAKSILKGLDCLHKRNLSHGNLKASNVLLNAIGDVKLTDYGLLCQTCQVLKSRKDKASQILGRLATDQRAAPEINHDTSHASPKSDIWSLGITLIEMAESIPPFVCFSKEQDFGGSAEDDDAPLKVTSLKEPPTLTHLSKWSPEFVDFVSQCLRLDPKKRPSAAELMEHPFIHRNVSNQSVLDAIAETLAFNRSQAAETEPKKIHKRAPNTSMREHCDYVYDIAASLEEQDAESSTEEIPIPILKMIISSRSEKLQQKIEQLKPKLKENQDVDAIIEMIISLNAEIDEEMLGQASSKE